MEFLIDSTMAFLMAVLIMLASWWDERKKMRTPKPEYRKVA
jgi:hypothetical protein